MASQRITIPEGSCALVISRRAAADLISDCTRQRNLARKRGETAMVVHYDELLLAAYEAAGAQQFAVDTLQNS